MRRPPVRPPSPYATIPSGPMWWRLLREYMRGTPTLGTAQVVAWRERDGEETRE